MDSKFASSTKDFSIKFVADDSFFTMVKPLSIMKKIELEPATEEDG